MTVEQLKPYLKEEWKRIKEELVRDEYRPEPVLKVEIPKAEGKGERWTRAQDWSANRGGSDAVAERLDELFPAGRGKGNL